MYLSLIFGNCLNLDRLRRVFVDPVTPAVRKSVWTPTKLYYAMQAMLEQITSMSS